MTNLRTWIIWTLRKASYRWPPRQDALRAAAVPIADYYINPGEKVTSRIRNFYRCRRCEKVFSRKGVGVDHVYPVVNPRRGWEGFDIYIARLFCHKEGFQVLCCKCHDEKTANERIVRTKVRKKQRV